MAKHTRSAELVLLHNGLVALVLAYPLAIALSGVLHQTMLALGAGAVVGQLAMWVVYPLWMTAIALVFLIPTKRACWLCLIAANGLAGTACYLLMQASKGAA